MWADGWSDIQKLINLCTFTCKYATIFMMCFLHNENKHVYDFIFQLHMMNKFWQTISYSVINFQTGKHTEPNLLNIHGQFKEYCLCQCRIALFNHGPHHSHISDSAKCYKGHFKYNTNPMALELKCPVDQNLNQGCITKAIIGHVLYQTFGVLNITLCDRYT
jgi:hypothetical protein